MWMFFSVVGPLQLISYPSIQVPNFTSTLILGNHEQIGLVHFVSGVLVLGFKLKSNGGFLCIVFPISHKSTVCLL